MVNFQTVAVSVATGALLAIGLWVFADGVIMSPDAFPWAHIIPVFLSLTSAFCINLMSPNQVEESSPVKVWLFFWFTVSMVCVGVGVWVTTNEYPAGDNWPGVAIIIQTMITLIACIVFFIGRKGGDDKFNF